jgi:hypothetical protein
MSYANPKESKVGDYVDVPINGEFMQDEQITQRYTVVLALKCNTPPNEQIIADGQEPMPTLLEFTSETGYVDN